MSICFRRRLVHGFVHDESRLTRMRAENFGDGPEGQATACALTVPSGEAKQPGVFLE